MVSLKAPPNLSLDASIQDNYSGGDGIVFNLVKTTFLTFQNQLLSSFFFLYN